MFRAKRPLLGASVPKRGRFGKNLRQPLLSRSQDVVTLLKDNFTDTNGVNLTAHTMDVGPGWTVDTGTWTIQTNRAQMPASTISYATSDSKQSDVTVTSIVNIATGTANGKIVGIVARFTAASDYWRITITLGSGTTFKISEITTGVTTDRAGSALTFSAATEYTLKAIFEKDNVKATVDGANPIEYSPATSNITATKCGMRNSFDPNQSYWDTFLVTIP